jgi:hypothetical protein
MIRHKPNRTSTPENAEFLPSLDGQITSDFQKPCQAPKSKIFLFSLDPNQFTDSPRLVPPEGRSRVVTSAGRDAVDARASGAQTQSQGEMNLVSGVRRAG